MGFGRQLEIFCGLELQKCEPYWPQPKVREVEEEEEDLGGKRMEEEEEEEEDGTGRIGRYLLKVKDSREESGFTVTDMEVQVHKVTIERKILVFYIINVFFASYSDINVFILALSAAF